MKIAVVGTRGVPATFGGIEKHCEELYTQLAKMGHDITIYARKGYVDDKIKIFNGVRIIPLWTIKSKHLEATFHTFWALLQVMKSDADIIHLHAQGPCLFTWLPKFFCRDKKIVFTCHGLDWQREKWGGLAKIAIYMGEIFSARMTDKQIMVSKSLNDYYRDKYKVSPVVIPNGTTIKEVRPAKIINERFGLDKDQYILFVGRLVPEKAPHKLIKAFKKVKTDKKLVIVGDSSATNDYVKYLKKLAGNDSRVIFTSYLYGEILEEIYSNAYLYVSASKLEGMPITLLEAMSYGIPSLVSNIAPHVEIIGGNEEYGYLFNADKLNEIKAKLQTILDKSTDSLKFIGKKGLENIKNNYNWNDAAKKLETVYRSI